MTSVILHTSMGDIKVKMHDDMPITTGNFVKLAKEGFYDGVIFHRVIDGFMIQGGDPDGTGMGGPGYTIEDEFGKGHSNRRGTMSMANTGRPNSGGSQFFINTVDNTYLDKEDPRTPYAHPVFGTVTGGMDVVDSIGRVETDRNDRPLKDVVINSVEVTEEVIRMSKHVMECLGLSRVTIEDGKVTEVTEPRVKYCPLFEKYRGIKELNQDTIRENIEYRIETFGMCTENRDTEMDDFLSFGISEIMSLALDNGGLDAVVMAADGCGTAVMTDPRIVQGMGGRISGICETEPIQKVVDAVGPENMLDPATARIDMVAGVEKAFGMGYGTVSVTTPFMKDARRMREKYGDRIVIIAVHTSGMSREDAETAFEVCDIITACASQHLRDVCHSRDDILVAGNKVPIYGVTDKGKELVQAKLDGLGRKAWDPSVPEVPPQPLI